MQHTFKGSPGADLSKAGHDANIVNVVSMGSLLRYMLHQHMPSQYKLTRIWRVVDMVMALSPRAKLLVLWATPVNSH